MGIKGCSFYFCTMASRVFSDQLGNQILLPETPYKIISLVPSQTELLASLGLDPEVIGITKFCVYPERWKKSKTIVGGTKKFRLEVIRALEPDLIIGNKEENDQTSMEELRKQFPVWMSNVITFQDALHMMVAVGEITGKETEAKKLVEDIRDSLNELKPITARKTLYLIWKNPWMGAASGTFIHTMLTLAGFENCLREQSRYPELMDEQLVSLSPDVVLLSSEPYPFKEKHIQELKSLLPKAKILLVDGEMFSWYGSRMLYFADYIHQLSLRLS
jgi:ABC-type Fe3+-hydroxamate transport system substrate-binding protein